MALGLYVLNVKVNGHVDYAQAITLGEETRTLETIELSPITINTGGVVFADGEDTHEQIIVRVRLNDALVSTTLSNEQGAFSLTLSPQNHELSFSKQGFIEQRYLLEWNEDHFVIDDTPISQAVIRLIREPYGDRDGDGIIDQRDNCPSQFNDEQVDYDQDGLGDLCDDDRDGDLVPNLIDNCPQSYNPSQEDFDGDSRGFTCTQAKLSNPMRLGCGIMQIFDTRGRESEVRGTCGGLDAPEMVFQINLDPTQVITVEARADYQTVFYLMNLDGTLVDGSCSIDQTWSSENLSLSGDYLLVIDGLSGADQSGILKVSVDDPRCYQDLPIVIEEFPNYPHGDPTHLKSGDFDGDGYSELIDLDTNNENLILFPWLTSEMVVKRF